MSACIKFVCTSAPFHWFYRYAYLKLGVSVSCQLMLVCVHTNDDLMLLLWSEELVTVNLLLWCGWYSIESVSHWFTCHLTHQTWQVLTTQHFVLSVRRGGSCKKNTSNIHALLVHLHEYIYIYIYKCIDKILVSVPFYIQVIVTFQTGLVNQQ